MKRKRILHILPSLSPGWAATQLRLLAHELPAEQFEFQVCALETRRDEPEISLPGVPVHRLGRSRVWDLRAFMRLKSQVADWQPDLVHAWSGAAADWAQALVRAAKVPRFVVSYSHVEAEPLWTQQLVDSTLMQRADRVLVHCAGVAELLRGRGWPAEQIRVIAHGVEPPVSSASRAEVLAELGLPTDTRLIGAVGQLRLKARWKDVIWATDMLKFIRDDVHLLIFGAGPHHARLERFRMQVRIEDKVHFLDLRTDLGRWQPHFDIFMSGREDAGQPLAMMEAMTASVPAIATDVPGSRELIRSGESGYVVPVGDRAVLARMAHKLLEDRPLAQRLGAAGQARILADFPPRRMADSVAALYREILD